MTVYSLLHIAMSFSSMWRLCRSACMALKNMFNGWYARRTLWVDKHTFSLALYLDFVTVTAEKVVANGSRTLTTLLHSTGYSWAHVIQKDDSERLICKRASPARWQSSQFFLCPVKSSRKHSNESQKSNQTCSCHRRQNSRGNGVTTARYIHDGACVGLCLIVLIFYHVSKTEQIWPYIF